MVSKSQTGIDYWGGWNRSLCRVRLVLANVNIVVNIAYVNIAYVLVNVNIVAVIVNVACNRFS